MLTVYLSNRQILVLQGKGGRKLSVQKVYSFDAPEGSLINGVVTDEDGLGAALREFWKEHKLPVKGVQLVVNSTQLNFKAVNAPKQNRRGTADFLLREFSDAEQAEEPVVGWWKLSEDSQAKTCCLAATLSQKTYLHSLIELFQKAGVTLGGICTALDAALSALHAMPQGHETCIIQIADGSSLLHILLVNGNYVYSNTNRLYSMPGTPEYGIEAARCVSNILQFVQAQRIEAEIHTVYLAGMQPADERECATAMQNLGAALEVQRLVCSEGITIDRRLQDSFGEYLYPAGGLIRAGNENDLLHMLGNDPERRKRNRALLRRILPSVAVGAALLAACAGFGAQHILLKSRNAVLQAYLSSETVIQECEEYDTATEENAVLQAGLTEIEEDLAALESYPRANSLLKSMLSGYTAGYDVTVSFSSFDAQSGQLNLATTAADVETINRYISVLREQSIFQSVDYTGYSFNDGTGDWTVNVTCVLSGEAGK